jgi:hypothetical protein
MALETLTKEDLLDYKSRLGKNSPSPIDAIRFGQLSMTLSKYLKQADVREYNDAILKRDYMTVDKYERKILKRTEKSNHVDRRSDVEIPLGTRVRIKADGKKGVLAKRNGWIVRVGSEESKFCIRIDNEESLREKVGRSEFTVLCGNQMCDNEGTKRCNRCLTMWYCSKDCQKANWRTHKSICEPFDKIYGCKGNVAVLPPMFMK